MDITVSHERGRVPVSVLHITGDIDSSNNEQLTQIAFKEIEAGAQYILIDLNKMQFMSSAGFRSLMKIFNKLRSLAKDTSEEEMLKGINTGVYKSPYLKLVKPSKRVIETMKLAGFDMFLEIHDTMKDALASF